MSVSIPSLKAQGHLYTYLLFWDDTPTLFSLVRLTVEVGKSGVLADCQHPVLRYIQGFGDDLGVFVSPVNPMPETQMGLRVAECGVKKAIGILRLEHT